MDWSSLSHLGQAVFIGICGLAFGIGVFAGQQR